MDVATLKEERVKFKKLTDFRSENFEGRPPDLRTLQKWPGVRKLGGEYYIDLELLTPERNTEYEAFIQRCLQG